MSRKHLVRVAGINVTVHPHSQDIYKRLFQKAFDLKRPIKLRVDQAAVITSLEDSESGAELIGVVGRFTEINLDEPWFNAATLVEATPGEVRRVTIPDNLKPHYRPFLFVFFLGQHLFAFSHYQNGRAVSARLCARFLTNLLNQPELAREFGQVDVTVVADQDSLDALLNVPRLKRVFVLVKKPNPDTPARFERALQQRLENMNARSVSEAVDAVPGEDLVPDEPLRNTARAALRNGRVDSEFIDEGGARTRRSSEDHPIVESKKYDAAVVTDEQAFRAAADSLVEKVQSAAQDHSGDDDLES